MSKLIVNEITKYDASQVTFTDNTNVVITGSLSTAGASVGGTLAVSGAATLSSTLGVTGVSTFTGNVNIGSAGSERLNIFGAGSQFINVKNTTSNADMFVGMSAGLGGGYIGTGGTDPMVLVSAGTERMRVKGDGDISFRDSSANEAFYWDASAASLGIGGAPSEVLEVIKNQNAITRISVSNSDSTNANSRASLKTNANGIIGEMVCVNGDSFYVGTASNHDLNLMANGSSKVRIDSSGNVGIGAALGAWYTGAGYKAFQFGNGSLYFRTSVAETYMTNNAYYNGSNWIYFTSDGAARYDQIGGYHAWSTAASATAGDTLTWTERMRINSDGYIGMGGGPQPAVTNSIWGTGSSSSTYSLICYNASGFGSLVVRDDGAVSVSGALSKGSGSFKIDHPLEDKKDTHHLVHSFVESPQANNIYRGKVQLVNGVAQVNLDEVSTMTEGTFVALNREIHTYTSNESDWDAVRGNVVGNILSIECQNAESNAIVSWLVIGERQDQHMMDTDWTDENGRVIVEPLKSDSINAVVPIVEQSEI